jgi:hypothetical protein
MTTDITTLPPADRAIIVLDSTKTEAQLHALIDETASIKEVIDQAGRDQAHRIGMKLKNARVTIEKTGKAAREDAQAFSKAVIGEEKRLIGIIDSEEKRVLGLRDGFDAIIEAEKAAKAAAEAKRVSEIKEKISGIRGLPLALHAADSATLLAEIAALEAFTPIAEVFFEFTDECKLTIADCLDALRDMHRQKFAQEEAARHVAAERERVADAERVAKEELDAERAALRAEREELDRRRAEIEAAEAERKAKEDAELESTRAADKANQAAVELHQANEAAMHAPSTLIDSPEIAEAKNAQAVRSLEVVAAMPPVDVSAGRVTVIENVAATTSDATISVSFADYKTRAIAIATSKQFQALGNKVGLCGAHAFANELYAVADAIFAGRYDDAIAGANSDDMVGFDVAMLDATAACIDSIKG